MINFLLAPFIAIGVMLGTLFAPVQESTLGASEAIPSTIAFFETTLASAISSTATSFTLTSATDKDGTTLASSTYAFVIDEGSSNEEIVIADCTGTACTNVERGISVRTGNTEVAALKKSHRRGASVKMTDAPVLVLISRALRGDDVTSFTPSGNGSLVTKAYVDALSFGGVVAATESDDGFSELATQVEMSSSTPLGSSGSSLVLQAKYATSSCQVVGRYVPITDPLTGRIDAGCLDTTYASSSITIGSTPILDIGKNVWASTTAGTSTFTVPTGITKIKVTLIGPGGNGGGSTGGTPGTSGVGGSAGGVSVKWYNVSATSTLQYHIGAVGEYSWFGGTYGSPTMQANSGTTGAENGSATAGGTATGGDLNLTGGSGTPGTGGGANGAEIGGHGGSNMYGYGGGGAKSAGGGANAANGTGCGGGGGGGADGSSIGTGAAGCLIIEY